MNIPVLIPAYNPNNTLIFVIEGLINYGFNDIIIIDDGSKLECENVFEELEKHSQCHVLRHAVNLGKGRALKTGLNYFYLNFKDSEGIITADADGQHKPEDILKIATALNNNPSKLILGVRSFSKKIPLRSLLGNIITKYIFLFFVGKKISDTQTGLRGIPRSAIPAFLKLDGERYEYETNVLISTKLNSINIIEEQIQTIYFDGNRSSLFNPLIDSMKIYFILMRFAFSSIFASIIDFFVFMLSYKITFSVLLSIAIARLISSIINFSINRRITFHNQTKILNVIIKYYILLIFMGFLSYILIQVLVTQLSFNIGIAKILAETSLFLVSFTIQRDFVFRELKEIKTSNTTILKTRISR
jgi:glycosyltransferase involved in cell wall biosynthesis